MPLCSEKMTILWYTGLSMHMQVLYLYKNDFPYGLNYFLRMHLTPQIISQILPQKAEDPQGVCVYIYYRDCHGMYNSQGLYISSGFILKKQKLYIFYRPKFPSWSLHSFPSKTRALAAVLTGLAACTATAAGQAVPLWQAFLNVKEDFDNQKWGLTNTFGMI